MSVMRNGKKLNKLYAISNSHNTVVHYRKGDFEFSNKFANYYDEVKNLLRFEDDLSSLMRQ